jgi:hypothetical protein
VSNYRVHFEVVEGRVGTAGREVEIEVSAVSMEHAMAEAREIAKRDYGENAKATGVVTCYGPRSR